MLIDENRIRDLFKLYYNDIYHYCLSITDNKEDAADIAQDTFLILIKKSPNLNNSNLRSWLYNTAYYEICKLLKKKTNELKRTPLRIDDNVEEDDLLSPFNMDIELDNLIYPDSVIEEHKEKVLSELKPKELELYHEIFETDKTYKEIAEELGTTEKTINVKAFRLRTKLKNILKTTIFLIFITFYYIFM